VTRRFQWPRLIKKATLCQYSNDFLAHKDATESEGGVMNY